MSTVSPTPFRLIHGSLLPLNADHIDTDQIIPGRFLTTTERAGIDRHLFHDWRLDAAGHPKQDCPLNQPRHCAATIIVAGTNFGCGSSREHAAWALVDAGFRAIIAPSFADIFRANAIRNGLLPIVVGFADHHRLLTLAHDEPDQNIEIGLTPPQLMLPGGTVISFAIDPFSRHCLIEGIDRLAFLQRQEDAIATFERDRRPRVHTLTCSANAQGTP